MLHGIGTDIVHIPRIVGLAQRYNGRFLRHAPVISFDKLKFLHQEEIREYDKVRRAHPNRAGSFLASRWAAKEALTKALGQGRFLFPDVKVDRTSSGAPYLTLYSTAKKLAEQLGVSQTLISISHETEYAVSFVTALKAQQPAATPAGMEVDTSHFPLQKQLPKLSPEAQAWAAAAGIPIGQFDPSNPGMSPMSGMGPLGSTIEQGIDVFDEMYEAFGQEKPKPR